MSLPFCFYFFPRVSSVFSYSKQSTYNIFFNFILVRSAQHIFLISRITIKARGWVVDVMVIYIWIQYAAYAIVCVCSVHCSHILGFFFSIGPLSISCSNRIHDFLIPFSVSIECNSLTCSHQREKNVYKKLYCSEHISIRTRRVFKHLWREKWNFHVQIVSREWKKNNNKKKANIASIIQNVESHLITAINRQMHKSSVLCKSKLTYAWFELNRRIYFLCRCLRGIYRQFCLLFPLKMSCSIV